MFTAQNKKDNIELSHTTIYDEYVGEKKEQCFYTKDEIEELIISEMLGVSFAGMPLRTRSKKAKELVCKALGYLAPNSFKKTQPRFPCQNLDIYVQKSNNLQVWNEELDPVRRYLLIRLDKEDHVVAAKVVSGVDLAMLDTTGTLTQKYQARLVVGKEKAELVSIVDTDRLSRSKLLNRKNTINSNSPIDPPSEKNVISIDVLFEHLKSLLGKSFKDIGADQERNRGAELHRLICKSLGYQNYADNGQFPDIKNQLLEVKLQTSPTIDLGLVNPDSDIELDMNPINGVKIRHKDIRYAIFSGDIINGTVVLSNLYLTTGESFFKRFQQFQGKVLNKKLQIPLPNNLFV